jgi:hypothetical protein
MLDYSNYKIKLMDSNYYNNIKFNYYDKTKLSNKTTKKPIFITMNCIKDNLDNYDCEIIEYSLRVSWVQSIMDTKYH